MTFLDVPGAHLYYETQGEGPLLFLIGSPMDSTGFAGLASAMADRYTVVTYDPRGIGKSTRDNNDEDITPAMQADDVHRLIATLADGTVDYFGSSGGAVVGLALIERYPHDINTFLGHEPPIISLLPDHQQLREGFQEIYDVYQTSGSAAAMRKFMEHVGLATPGEPLPWQPTPEQMAAMEPTNRVFYQHLIRQTPTYEPDFAALRAAPTRIVMGAGETSKGQMPNRAAVAFSEAFGVPLVHFPGDHGGFQNPEPFSRVLKEVLIGRSGD